MKLRQVVLASSALFVLAACGGVKRAGRAVGRVFGIGVNTDAWVAVVNPNGAETLRGTIILGKGDAVGTARATIEVAGGTGGSNHPWHVHKGKCGDNGEIVGSPSSYDVLIVDEAGSIKHVDDLDFAVPPNGDFYVNLHKSPTQMALIVACGQLVPRTAPDTSTRK